MTPSGRALRIPARGVYAITPAGLCARPEDLLAAVEAALRAGIALLQYRDKFGTPTQRLALGKALADRCAVHGVPLIVNDDPQLAAACGAAGVHLGMDDASVAEARALLGATALVGVTCGAELGRAQRAVAEGADYVAFGAFYATTSKPEATRAPLSLLREACKARLGVPVCAIGGITAANARPLVVAGADLLAAIDGVFGAADIAVAVGSLNAAFGDATARDG